MEGTFELPFLPNLLVGSFVLTMERRENVFTLYQKASELGDYFQTFQVCYVSTRG